VKRHSCIDVKPTGSISVHDPSPPPYNDADCISPHRASRKRLWPQMYRMLCVVYKEAELILLFCYTLSVAGHNHIRASGLASTRSLPLLRRYMRA